MSSPDPTQIIIFQTTEKPDGSVFVSATAGGRPYGLACENDPAQIEQAKTLITENIQQDIERP